MGAEELRGVTRVLDSDVLSGFIGAVGSAFNGGPEVRAFEDAWARKFGFAHAISVNSWTSGLMAAVAAIGIEPGDEVICSPYTMSASATSALFYGGIPVFADIDPGTFNLDPASVRRCITSRTKAIIVVHLFGHPAEMDSILAIAAEHGLKVIEDAAQAPGVMYRGRPVGALGTIGGFSLNYHKHIHTGEGGMLVTNDEQVAQRAQLIRNHGENAFEMFGITDLSNVIGGNYRLTELQAAIGLAQLDKLDGILARRTELAGYLDSRLRELPGLTVQQVPADCTHAYYMYPIRYDATVAGLSRGAFRKAVSAELPAPKSWETTPLAEGYVKPLYLNSIYQRRIAIGSKGFPFNLRKDGPDYGKGLCPVTERLYEREMLLTPLIREPLTVGDVKDLADAIEKVIANAAAIRGRFPDAADGEMLDPARALDAVSPRP
jgi:perosamine synthetase